MPVPARLPGTPEPYELSSLPVEQRRQLVHPRRGPVPGLHQPGLCEEQGLPFLPQRGSVPCRGLLGSRSKGEDHELEIENHEFVGKDHGHDRRHLRLVDGSPLCDPAGAVRAKCQCHSRRSAEVGHGTQAGGGPGRAPGSEDRHRGIAAAGRVRPVHELRQATRAVEGDPHLLLLRQRRQGGTLLRPRTDRAGCRRRAVAEGPSRAGAVCRRER